MNKITRRSALTVLLAVPFAASVYASEAIFTDGAGLAIRGTDPVAYFTQGKPVEGSEEFETTFAGSTWRFASAQNREKFIADPSAYMPQYGGYCAYAASKNAKATTVPEAWTIVDGKLYLNYSTNVRGIWSEDIPGNTAAADANWPTLRDQ